MPAVKIIHSISEMDSVQAGDVLVTDMTIPDWEPITKNGIAIVTESRGGRTCHAAIIAPTWVSGCGRLWQHRDFTGRTKRDGFSCAEAIPVLSIQVDPAGFQRAPFAGG